MSATATPSPATSAASAPAPHLTPHLARTGGALVTLLASLYLLPLIPMILGGHGNAVPASAGATALACALGTALFALGTRLPFAVGPGIVPAAIIAGFVAQGIPWTVVLGIELWAGMAFVVLVASGALQAFVGRMPALLKTTGQLAIGLYLFMAALRAGGVLQSGAGGAPALGAPAWLFLGGLATVFALRHSKRLGGSALLIGMALASAGAVGLGLGGAAEALQRPAFAWPQLQFQGPDLAGAFAWQYLDEMLVLLYVVVVDVVATLEALAASSPHLRCANGRPRQFERALFMSAVVFMASPFLGTAPMLVLFENLGGVLSGARGRLSAAVCVLGFALLVVLAPLAAAVPAFACAVALAFVGYSIARFALLSLPQPATDGTSGSTVPPLARQLAMVAVVATVATHSLGLSLLLLFAAYPLLAWRSGQPLRQAEMAAAALSLGLVALALR